MVLGILFALGATGGFVLSLEASPLVKDSIVAHDGGSGGGSQEGAAEGDGSKQARAGQNGKRGGSEGSGGGGAGGDKQSPGPAGAGHQASAKDASADNGQQAANAGAQAGGTASARADAQPAQPAPCHFADITGSEAAAFLSGNTVKDLDAQESDPEIVYFAPRGLMARYHRRSVVLNTWNTQSASLCTSDPRSASPAICDEIHVRKCIDADRASFHLGDLRNHSGHWLPVLRGNLQSFPSYIPYVDSPFSAAAPGETNRPAGKGRRRGDADLLERNAVFRYTSPAGPDQGRVVYFENSGRRYEFDVPTAESFEAGFTIDVGWWKRNHGTLCESTSEAETKPLCRSMSGKGGTLILRSASHGADAELTAVHDVRPVLIANDGQP